jgi:hypothetical protein
MLLVIGKMAYVRDFIPGMTVMTLMTMYCKSILDARLVCHPRWISSIVQSLESGTCSTGFWDGNRCHHYHHFVEGSSGSVVGHARLSRVYGLSPRGCCAFVVTAVTPVTGHDAHDGPLRAYSRQGALLYFLGRYPFNLTRRTRRTEQGAPYLCDL